MARTTNDAKLDSPTSRLRMATGKRPHWKTLVPQKLHLGYRRKDGESGGMWLVRRYVGNERYRVTPIGRAHDLPDDQRQSANLTFEEAQAKALAHRIEVEGRPMTEDLTVQEAIEDYVHYLFAEKKTGADAERRAKANILPVLGRVKVAELTKRQIEKWRNDLARQGAFVKGKKGKPLRQRAAPETEEEQRKRKASVNRVLTTLKAALNRAYGHNDRIAAKPDVWREVKPFREVEAARTSFLSMTEVTRVINASDQESGFRDLVRAALATGARYGELVALNVADFTSNRVAIRLSKSGKPRFIRLTDEGIELFRQLTAGRAGTEPMFAKKGERWKPSDQLRPMREACMRARVEPAVGFHQLRHTWASHAVMNGMPLMVVALNLGHSDTKMVEKHYGHLTEGWIDKAFADGAPSFGVVEKSHVLSFN